MMKTTAAFGPEPILSSATQERSRRASFLVKQGQTRQMEKGVVFGTSLLGYDVKDGSMTVKLTMHAGRRMSYHKHEKRSESISVIAGSGRIILDGTEKRIEAGDVLQIPAGCAHTVIADSNLDFIEVQTGQVIDVKDKIKL